MIGAGRALPHKGLSALQPWNTSKESTSTLRGRKKAPIGFILYRTPASRRKIGMEMLSVWVWTMAVKVRTG